MADLPVFSPEMTRHLLSRKPKTLTKGERAGVEFDPAPIRDDPLFREDAERLRKSQREHPFGVTTQRQTV